MTQATQWPWGWQALGRAVKLPGGEGVGEGVVRAGGDLRIFEEMEA